MAFPIATGCAARHGAGLPEAPVAGTSPATRQIRGTIRDLPAAVRYAASRTEMAVLQREWTEPETLVFHLISARDEPATLTVTLRGEGDPDGRAHDPEARGEEPRGAFAGFVTDFRPDLAIPGSDLERPMDASMRIALGRARREARFLAILDRRLRELEKGGGVAPSGPDG